MATLHVRNVPDELHERIRSLASERKRSLSAQVLVMLDDALRRERHRATFTEIVEQMRRDRHEYPKGKGIPDSVELLREDRAR